MIQHLLYKTTCIITEKFYYGMHSTENIDDGYMGSGIHLNYSLKKHGIKNHIREIIATCDSREALEQLEASIIDENMLTNPLCMNLVPGGRGGAQRGEKNSFFGKHHKQSTIEKIRTSMQGEKGPCFGRVGALHPQFGKKHTPEARVKMSTAHLGVPLTDKHVENIKQGHAIRNHDKIKRNTQILQLIDEGVARQDIAKTLNLPINIVYGAVHKRNKALCKT